jgi:hypothetical protein
MRFDLPSPPSARAARSGVEQNKLTLERNLDIKYIREANPGIIVYSWSFFEGIWNFHWLFYIGVYFSLDTSEYCNHHKTYGYCIISTVPVVIILLHMPCFL